MSRRLVVVLVLAVVVVVVVAVAVTVTSKGPRRAPGLAANAVISASSTGSTFSPEALLDSGSAQDPGDSWVADGPAVGSWVELTWPQPVRLDSLVVVGTGDRGQQVSAGFLTFGDHTSVQAPLASDQPATTVAFAAREVTTLRFTLSSMGAGSSTAALAELIPGMATGPQAVVVDQQSDGNSATTATPTASGGTRVDGLNDGEPTVKTQVLRASWSVDPGVDSWAQLSWAQPRELASVQLFGSQDTPQHILSARLEFDAGPPVTVGEIPTGTAHPTTLSFLPRVSKFVRLVVTKTSGPGSVGLMEFRAYAAGATPARLATTPTIPSQVADPDCPPAPANPAQSAITVTCPTMGASVGASATVDFLAPGITGVAASVWPSDPATVESSAPEVNTSVKDGRGSVVLSLSGVERGPLTVRLRATDPAKGGATTYLQLYYNGGDFTSPARVGSPAQAGQRTLVYDDEFGSALSLSRDGKGADYAASKPAYWGADEFGDAIFPDPKAGFDNVSVVDQRYLRIGVEPSPAGFADPNKWGRTHIGGIVASARTGGSGFAAQYGYYEARMLAPAGAGTWPAFWQLPTPNLIAEQPGEAEIDTVELYGHDILSACHATHQYVDRKSTGGKVDCGKRYADARAALTWHVYAADVTPTEITYYIDGKEVATLPQVAGGDQPMFFMLNLELGGGWPIKLDTVGNRASLYVDYVRVYV